MKTSRQWENISENTYRLRTANGWVVKEFYTFILADKSCSVAMELVYVPDGKEPWELEDR